MFGAYNETECLGGEGGEIKESKKTESKQQKKTNKKKLGLEDQISACLWSVLLTNFHTSLDNLNRTTKSTRAKSIFFFKKKESHYIWKLSPFRVPNT